MWVLRSYPFLPNASINSVHLFQATFLEFFPAAAGAGVIAPNLGFLAPIKIVAHKYAGSAAFIAGVDVIDFGSAKFTIVDTYIIKCAIITSI